MNPALDYTALLYTYTYFITVQVRHTQLYVQSSSYSYDKLLTATRYTLQQISKYLFMRTLSSNSYY